MDQPMDLHPAILGCLEACRRCNVVVEQLTGRIATESDDSPHPIGSHLRHCLDHFTCLVRGLEMGFVDYDARDRAEFIERDPEAFRRALSRVLEQLQGLSPQELKREIRVSQMPAADAPPLVVYSSVERELIFLSGHTIHHLALIAILAQNEGIALPEELTMAFSTAAYRSAAVG